MRPNAMRTIGAPWPGSKRFGAAARVDRRPREATSLASHEAALLRDNRPPGLRNFRTLGPPTGADGAELWEQYARAREGCRGTALSI